MPRLIQPAFTAALLALFAGQLPAQPAVYTPGQLKPQQEMAHEIYKELIEINSGVTTGNVTDCGGRDGEAVPGGRNP